jgi:hypothetical protein
MSQCFSELRKAEEYCAEANENLITNFRITHLETLLELCHVYR